MNKVSRKINFLFICAVVLFFSISCKTKKKAQEATNKQSVSVIDSVDEKCKMDYKNSKTLVRLMKQHELEFKTFSGKLNCEVNSGQEENSFNISVRCRKDSAIWINISKLGIDALRMLITRDTVKFMIMTNLGELDKGYFKGDYSYINHALNADLDYDMLQSLLVGNSADFLNDSIRMKGGKDKSNCLYYLSTVRRRKFNKIIDGKEPKESLQAIWLDPLTWKITMLEFIDVATNRKFSACYGQFQQFENTSVPLKHTYNISAEKSVKVDMNWSKFTFNEPVSFPYKVPSSYEQLILKEKK
ncbi:MAG: DUF4292 domain-containing protein [Bacteroidota bacterium]|jgi:outer membrane lipoprotein-sorting protein